MDHAAPGVGGVPCIRAFHAASQPRARRAVGHNQEPVPDAPPPTDFGKLDILGQTPAPSTAVDTCLADGFALDSGLRITRGAGALLVGGEAFAWRPWDPAGRRLVNEKGQWEVEDQAFALLALSWPRPGRCTVEDGVVGKLLTGRGAGVVLRSPHFGPGTGDTSPESSDQSLHCFPWHAR